MVLAARLAATTQSGGVIYRKNADGGVTVMRRANGADIFLTAIVTSQGETAPDVDLATTGQTIEGVVVGSYIPYEVDLSRDSDNPYPDNTELQIYKPVNGDWLYGTVATATALVIETFVDQQGGFLIAGTRDDHIGIAKQAAAGVSGTERIILYEWDAS